MKQFAAYASIELAQPDRLSANFAITCSSMTQKSSAKSLPRFCV